MISSRKLPLICLGAMVVWSVASPASAEEWTRKTAHGGEISRSVTRDGNVYTGSTTRTGPNGGTYTSSSTCKAGVVDRCSRSYSGAGPNGQTFSGQRYSAAGPFGGRSVGSFTGPNGNTVYGFRRWRR
ncbi:MULTISPECIES: hypothetical protein [unclassified Mesorhizobium]|uniref:hypothetical protein n=1 Tax=unclassified Mesorhizobium TaxID=325217 RepID=UPI000FCB4C9B|nr:MULTISPECIES: hypothetical protein [unclassified Mesorhizobium]TGP20222.1 hypothetical protein EN874_025920 [Mesorhizobium sp. M1D.F.Ca.ET.231.01.1.1]TGP27699.1 hypothetical protein EN877_25210 [Mesorhizobium sp. M1D.F.Ca.ET.234.01.1.1]TGS42049.1 hypothetical protein EN827_24295 [Mesorhizobium sp. M1D.F.Ca.ET.184.01.1.1]TGS59401.1 hypothetical protein EN826_024295 [Mesorhizobium sp. M1D.F.Ca.ET.183.01.1.1]